MHEKTSDAIPVIALRLGSEMGFGLGPEAVALTVEGFHFLPIKKSIPVPQNALLLGVLAAQRSPGVDVLLYGLAKRAAKA
jgi:hypothetical protein